MNDKAARNLRYIGLVVVLVCALLLALPALVPSGVEIDYSDTIASTLAIGIGLLLLSEVGPMIKTLKAGGIEIEFLDTVNDRFNALETKIAQLELALSRSARAADETAGTPGAGWPKLPTLADHEPAPALKREIKYRDDLNKDRFGGLAERDGFKLTGNFRSATKHFAEVLLRVEALRRDELQDLECVEFHLHDTFEPQVVPAIFHGGVAELSIITYGGFTVGVWIPCTQTELELDLATVKGAPKIVRDN